MPAMNHTAMRAYLTNLHAHMAGSGRRRNAHNLRVVIAALERLVELEQYVAVMEMELSEDRLQSTRVAISSADDQSRSPPSP
jgi:hypothetical protein